MNDSDSVAATSAWRGHGTVLVADDDDGTREAFRRLLVTRGFGVVDVSDGVTAIRAFHAFGREIVAVLMDTRMPRLNGPEACEAIRAMAPNVPMLSVSAMNDVSSLYRPGLIREHIQLPVRVEDLLTALRRLLEP